MSTMLPKGWILCHKIDALSPGVNVSLEISVGDMKQGRS